MRNAKKVSSVCHDGHGTNLPPSATKSKKNLSFSTAKVLRIGKTLRQTDHSVTRSIERPTVVERARYYIILYI